MIRTGACRYAPHSLRGCSHDGNNILFDQDPCTLKALLTHQEAAGGVKAHVLNGGAGELGFIHAALLRKTVHFEDPIDGPARNQVSVQAAPLNPNKTSLGQRKNNTLMQSRSFGGYKVCAVPAHGRAAPTTDARTPCEVRALCPGARSRRIQLTAPRNRLAIKRMSAQQSPAVPKLHAPESTASYRWAWPRPALRAYALSTRKSKTPGRASLSQRHSFCPITSLC